MQSSEIETLLSQTWDNLTRCHYLLFSCQLKHNGILNSRLSHMHHKLPCSTFNSMAVNRRQCIPITDAPVQGLTGAAASASSRISYIHQSGRRVAALPVHENEWPDNARPTGNLSRCRHGADLSLRRQNIYILQKGKNWASVMKFCYHRYHGIGGNNAMAHDDHGVFLLYMWALGNTWLNKRCG